MTADVLATLAAQLRADESVISPHVCEPEGEAALGALAAAGGAAAADPAGYALVVESVREGYLLHYGEPRLLAGADRDLRLLAGDYLYALGLERLAQIGDLPAVRQLSDLISLSAQLHEDGAGSADLADSLWLASVMAVGTGSHEPLVEPKAALRAGRADAGAALDRAADRIAEPAGLASRLARLRDGIDFPADLG